MAKNPGKKKTKHALDKYIQASEKLQKAMACFRTTQFGFKEAMKNEILDEIRKTKRTYF